ncbi:MAG: hypothetical protein KF690_04570 [Bacteroidetes bacterium]|nr:hypothetical protein [Bacteroidota bacterium]
MFFRNCISVFGVFAGLWGGLQAQQQIEVLNADLFTLENSPEGSVRKLQGNVQMKQDSALLYCHTAWHYPQENRMRAEGSLRIVLKNGVVLTADQGTYDGRTRVAHCWGNVVLVDSTARLETSRLTYYRNEGYAYYDTGGKLTEADNVLTSRVGYYYPDRDLASFRRQVRLTSGEGYRLYSDSLEYLVKKERALLVAPTRVWNADSTRTGYACGGYYDSPREELFLHTRARLQDTAWTLLADTLFYNSPQDTGWAHCRVYVLSADSTRFLAAERARFRQLTREVWLWENPWLVEYAESDTLSLFADSLYARDDSVAHVHLFEACKNARLHMKDLQSRSGWLQYLRADSLITLAQDPVLWSSDNQLTGDTIRIWVAANEVDSLFVDRNAFMLSRVDSSHFYHQLRGRQVFARFKNNQLCWMQVVGNCESIYFMEDGPDFVGMNQAYAAQLTLWLEDNSPVRLRLDTQPKGTFFPIHEVWQNPPQLEGFYNRSADRPRAFITVRP